MPFDSFAVFLPFDLACLGAAPALMRLSRLRTERRRIGTRLRGAIGAHQPRMAEARRQLARKARRAGPRARLLALVRYDEAKAPDYAASPLVVLAVAAALGFVPARLAASMLGPLGLLAWPAVALLLVRLFYLRHERRVAERLYAQFPEALGMIVRAVRVGVPITESMKVVAREAAEPTAHEFARLADKITIGVALEDALQQAAQRSGLAEYRFFATALALQAQTGGGLSETLERLADTIRKRIAARERGRALASEARTTALILAALPFVIGVLLWVIDPAYMGLLLHDRGGNMLLGFAAGMLGLGVFAMRTIIRRSLT